MKSLRGYLKHRIALALATLALMTLFVLLNHGCGRLTLFTNRSSSKSHNGLTFSPSGPAPMKAAMNDTFGKMPLYFTENRGQVDDRVAYYIQGSDKTIGFTRRGLTFLLTGPVDHGPTEHEPRLSPVAHAVEPHGKDAMRRWALKLDFLGANPDVKLIGEEPTPAVISYFKGPRSKWQTGLKTYSRIVYQDLWPGIDLEYAGDVNRMKYTFKVKAGADPSQIRLAYRGATSVMLNQSGQLEVSTPVCTFHDDEPYSFQDVEGKRVEVATSYSLEERTVEGAQEYGFLLGDYDKTQPLVLDPAALIYAGFIGGSASDSGNGIVAFTDFETLDEEAYVTGATSSLEISFPDGDGFLGESPIANGPDKTLNVVSRDAFVAKVGRNGNLIYAGYLGGDGDDVGNAIAIFGPNLEACITGTTSFDQDSFPSGSPNFGDSAGDSPDRTYNGGNSDAFVAVINREGTGLVFNGWIGGSGSDFGKGIAVDAEGNTYITGSTNSSNQLTDGFSSIPGLNKTLSGGQDAFLVKINFQGTAVTYATYIGGPLNDSGNGMALDDAANVYITGDTFSSRFTALPVPPSPDLNPVGSGDAFVVKINTANAAENFMGFIGGIEEDNGNGIAVDRLRKVYLTGATQSSQSSFRVKNGPILEHKGGKDVFVARLSPGAAPNVMTIDYAGYIGGSGDDIGLGIAVDVDLQAYVTGSTKSSKAEGFPARNGPNVVNNGNGDAFIAKVQADGLGLAYSGFIGGTGADEGRAISVLGLGKAFIVGTTSSVQEAGFPVNAPGFPVKTAPDLTYNQNTDAFVAKINDVERGPVIIPENDLSISGGSLHNLPKGEIVDFPFKVTNLGETTAFNVMVTASLGDSLSFLSCSNPAGGCEVDSNNVFTASIPELPPGAFVNVRIVAKVKCSVVFEPEQPDGPLVIEVQGRVMSPADDNSGNDVASVFLNVTRQAFDIRCAADIFKLVTFTQGLIQVPVDYPLPTTIGDCEGATPTCAPPPGSGFVVGVTRVNCRAINSAGLEKTCGFTVTISAPSVKDDATGDTLQFNALTGDYRFTQCNPSRVFAGKGEPKPTASPCGVRISHTTADYTLLADVHLPGEPGASCPSKRGTVSWTQKTGTRKTITIRDLNTENNTGPCQAP